MSCNWCDMKICPNSEWNREKVDFIIEKNFDAVDTSCEVEVNNATNNIISEVSGEWIKPCKGCMKIDDFIESQKQWVISILK